LFIEVNLDNSTQKNAFGTIQLIDSLGDTVSLVLLYCMSTPRLECPEHKLYTRKYLLSTVSYS
jgi:hypothetical protein